MSSSIGKAVKIQIFGQSHSAGLGVVIDSLPANEPIDLAQIYAFLKRRQGGQNAYSTKRLEADLPTILSGIVGGKTCGAPLCATFENSNVKSSDYDGITCVPRPSHADLNAALKYSGANDVRGGGHFSGRLTLPLCFAGAVCSQILSRMGVTIGAHIASIGDINDTTFDPINVSKADLASVACGFPTIDFDKGVQMESHMTAVAHQANSVGGTIECAIIGAMQGLGDPMFDGIENQMAAMLFGIPALKGVEFGAGFGAAKMMGSEHNDEYYYDEKSDSVQTKTNHAGGIIGGISTGAPILFKVAIKPTPSIGLLQNSVNLQTKQNEHLIIKGRHDPCIVPRAVPCVEAVAAIVTLDLIMQHSF